MAKKGDWVRIHSIDVYKRQDMAAMNYQVESLGKEPREVAKEFLKELGLIG